MMHMERQASAWWVGLLATWLLSFGSAGCGIAPLNRAQLEKDVVQQDPDFAWVLDRRRSLAKRMDIYERELALKRNTTEQAIAQLRKDLAGVTATVRSKIVETKRQMEPERVKLDAQLAEAMRQLRGQRDQLAQTDRAISALRRSDKASGASHESQINEMVRDAKRLDQEVALIKEHIRLIKTKLLLIRF